MSSALLMAVGAFIVIAALILLPYYQFVVRAEQADRSRLVRRLKARTLEAPAPSRSPGVLKEEERHSTIGPLNRVLASERSIAGSLRMLVSQSGLKVTPGQIVLGSACLGLLTYFLIATRTGVWWLGIAGGAGMTLAPYFMLRVFRTQRLHKFEEHFPEAVALIARALRAGHAFTVGLRIAADELPDPVATEFKYLHDQQNYGLPLNDALRTFARRVPIIDARFFVTAVLTQREAGGNLAEVLDNLASVIRERFRIRRQIRVITARGRMTGWILTALPPGMAAFFMIRTPEHFSLLFDDPTGVKMVVGALVLQGVGAILIRRITAVEY